MPSSMPCAAAGRRCSARARSSTAPSAARAGRHGHRSVVQRQVDVDRAGVMFTIDPSTGATDHVVIEGAFGLGEAVVSGRVSPDRYVVDKATLAISAREIHPKTSTVEARDTAARSSRSRPRRRRSRPDRRRGTGAGGAGHRSRASLRLRPGHRVGHRPRRKDLDAAVEAGDGRRAHDRSRPQGRSCCAGSAPPVSASGPVCVLGALADAGRFSDGDVLVTRMTAPDWVPLMRRAAAIATDSGG